MAGKFLVGISVLIEHEGCVLLLHRAASKDFGKGEWEPVSGRVEQGENAEQAAIREVFEETGLTATSLEAFDTFSFVRGSTGEELIGITFRTRVNTRMVVLSDEHDAYDWVSVSDLVSVQTNAAIASCFRKYIAIWSDGIR